MCGEHRISVPERVMAAQCLQDVCQRPIPKMTLVCTLDSVLSIRGVSWDRSWWATVMLILNYNCQLESAQTHI